MNLKKHLLLFAFLFLGILPTAFSQNQNNEEPISDLQLFCSEQKGFNLLGKFDVNWSNKGYKEKEFQIIEDLGFNFVRLPIDYRTYTLTNNWNYFIESRIKTIDDAIQWGEKYKVHVCINLHRAPGYCVNPTNNLPVEHQRDLWTDTLAQNVFVNHWEFFAERYKNISPQRLSFNLVNEPNNVTEEVYVAVMKKAIDVIHKISPNRIVFVDGLNYGGGVILSLKDEANIAQAIHCYQPFQLTHYKASWANGSDTWPVPRWPILMVNNYLYGTWKSEFESPLVFKGSFPVGTEIIINVHKVSIQSKLQIKADNKIVYTKNFVCGSEPGTDFTEVVNTEWGYQNISNKDFFVSLTDSASQLTFENIEGDWMTINSVSLLEGTDTTTYNFSDGTWGKKQDTYIIDEARNLKTEAGNDLLPFQDYQNTFTTARENNIPFMVQEFGVHNQTPHKVTLDFLDDLIAFFAENDVGWAIWNLEGSFGILNSGRSDCTYEPYNSYQLDRQMLDVLLKSNTTASPSIELNESFTIYPIPAKDKLYLKGNELEGQSQIEIRNVLGVVVKTFEIYPNSNESVLLDISELKSDIYLVSVLNSKKRFTKKILIQK